MRPNSHSFMPKISQETLNSISKRESDLAAQECLNDLVKESCYIYPKPEHNLEKICTALLPKFVHLSPDEAAKAAINYAKALIKELDI